MAIKRWFALSPKKQAGLVFRSPFARDTYLSFDESAESVRKVDCILECEQHGWPLLFRDGKEVGSEVPAVRGVHY